MPTGLLDARPRADADLEDFGLDPDGGPGPDLGTVDALAPDLAGPDLGIPDLSPADDGGGPSDADPTDGPPSPDTGLDAGTPDLGPPDVGPPVDAGCGLPLPNTPAVVATYTVPHAIDRPALIFDADGDGDEEIIVASSANQTMSIIEIDACGQALISTVSNVRMDRDGPAGVIINGAPAIVTAGNDEVRGYRYDPANIPAITTNNGLRAQNLGTLEFVTGDPPGENFLVSGRDSDNDPIYSAFETNFSRTETGLTEALTHRAAFLGPFGSGLASYLGASNRGLEVLFPGQAEVLIDSGSGLAGESDVSSFRVGTVPVSGRALAVYGAQLSSGTRQVRFVLVDPQSPSGPDRGSVGLSQPLISGPTLATRQPTVGADDLLVYFVREPNHLTGCTVENVTSQVVPMTCGAFPGVSTGVNLGVNNAHPEIEPVTAYINNDGDIDVIMALRTGNLMMLEHVLSQIAAPTLQLGRTIAGTPALSLAIYDRLQLSGSALAVPHTDGTVSLVGWATPTNAGSAARLWFQHRRDAARSGSL